MLDATRKALDWVMGVSGRGDEIHEAALAEVAAAERVIGAARFAYRAMGGKEEGDSWVAISDALFDLDALKEQKA